MKRSFDPRGASGIKHVNGPPVVHLIKLPTIADPEVRVRGQVVDPSAPGDRPIDGRPVPDVGEDNLDVFRQMRHFGPRPLDDPDTLPISDKPIHKVTADEPGPAGHDRQVVVHDRLLSWCVVVVHAHRVIPGSAG